MVPVVAGRTPVVIHCVPVTVEDNNCPGVPRLPCASKRAAFRVVVAKVVLPSTPRSVVIVAWLEPSLNRPVLVTHSVPFHRKVEFVAVPLAGVVTPGPPTNSKVLVPVWLKLRLPLAVRLMLFPPLMFKLVWVVVKLDANSRVWLSVVDRVERSRVTVFPSLMAKVMVLFALKAEAVSVWLSVPLFSKALRLRVTVFPLLMAKVMVLLALRAEAVNCWLSLEGRRVQVLPPPTL